MFCWRCGQDVPEGSQFCRNCGQPAASAPSSTTVAPPPPPVASTLQRVGGALLFFCVAFTVLWPLWVLSQYARIHFRLNPLATIGLVRLGFGVLTGIMLWARQPAAMVLLRIHLAVSAAFSAYSLVTLFHFLVRYGFYRFGLAPIYLSWGITIGFLLAAVIYFSTSERVRATYGSKLFG